MSDTPETNTPKPLAPRPTEPEPLRLWLLDKATELVERKHYEIRETRPPRPGFKRKSVPNADIQILTVLYRCCADLGLVPKAPARTEISGPGGAPITMEMISELSEEQLDALIATNDVRSLALLATVAVPHGDHREAEEGAGSDSSPEEGASPGLRPGTVPPVPVP